MSNRTDDLTLEQMLAAKDRLRDSYAPTPDWFARDAHELLTRTHVLDDQRDEGET
jgi:hypothetical protein